MAGIRGLANVRICMVCVVFCLVFEQEMVVAIPTVQLNNGIEIPMIGLGMGSWCNNARCPRPAKPCGPCYNNTIATANVLLAASVGFTYIDTALGYGNQVGVGEAVNQMPSRRQQLFVQTKVPGCRQSMTPEQCKNETMANFLTDLAQLNLSYVDIVLLHSPPTNNNKGQACAGDLCALAAAQWEVMEEVYNQKLTRAIGVSNWCQRCFSCIKTMNSTITPMLNQIQYHAGMPGTDPNGLISFCKNNKIVPQAYSPLGNYASHSLISNNVTIAMGKKYGVSSAQIALRWVIQNKVPLIVAANVEEYLKEDLSIFNFTLSTDDFNTLANSPLAPEGPTRGSCVGEQEN